MFRSSIIPVVQITTAEKYSRQATLLAALLEQSDSSTLDVLATGLSNSSATVGIIDVLRSSSVVEATNPTVPGPVQTLDATFPSFDCTLFASLNWEKPLDDGGATISSYVIACTSLDPSSTVVELVQPSFESIDIGPFVPDSTYTCSIRALNAEGFSAKTSANEFDVM